MLVSGSREPWRVLEQGWDKGHQGRERGEQRQHGEGSRGGGAEEDAGLSVSNHSPWIPIMCSRMSTLSAKIFRASRSCCTPSPWGGESRGVRATLLQHPVPACHFLFSPSSTQRPPQIRDTLAPGLGFELQFTDTELEAQTG